MTIVSMKEEPKDEVKIRELMERWQVWRDERRKQTLAQLGYGETFLKQCLDDMPGVICPACRGKDQECQLCNGSGRIDLESKQVLINPAFIRSTGIPTADDISGKIDEIVSQFRQHGKTIGYYYVVLQEYARNGTREIKAERMHLNVNSYKVKLCRAHALIEKRLHIEGYL